MRDLTFKSLTSEDRRRRELSISETADVDGVQVKTDKRWTYAVKNQVRLSEAGNLRKWLQDRIGVGKPPNLKYLSILKSHNSKLHEDKFTCNAIGELFILSEKHLFTIEFFYLLKIELAASSCKK